MDFSRRVRKAYSIWRREGTIPLARDAAELFRKAVLGRYLRYKGYQTLTLGGVTARFDASDRDVLWGTRWQHDCEGDFVEEVLEVLRSDDVFFDVGANIGIYAAFAAQVVHEGQVVAFEPFPPNVEVLRRNAELNGDRIDVHGVALSNRKGTATFRQPKDRPGSCVGAISPEATGAAYEVDVVPLDDLVASGEVPVPTVVKIDVEGAEPLVLEGMEETLEDDDLRVVFCEVHPPGDDPSQPSVADFGSSVGELEKLLRSKGFSLREIAYEGRGQDHIVAERV